MWRLQCAWSWTFFWLVGGEIPGWYFRNFSYPFSDSNSSGVCVLVIILQLLSPPGQGSVSSKKPKYIHHIIYNIIVPPLGTKHSWLCFMAEVFLFCLALTTFPCVYIFSLFWLNVLLGSQGRLRWLRLFYKWGMRMGLILGRPCRVLLSFDTAIKQLGKWMGWEPGVPCWGAGYSSGRWGGKVIHVVMARVRGIRVDSRLA